jgi:hypothetical protein
MTANFGTLAALLTAVCALLGYIAVVIRWIAKRLKMWEQLVREHRVLMDAGHWHEDGRIVPVAYYMNEARHRRRDDWPP